ncbi:MAG: sensor histidine kinase [Gallionella sp.]
MMRGLLCACWHRLIRPLRLNQPTETLTRQLRLVMENYNAALPQILLVTAVIFWGLVNPTNALAMQLWSVSEVVTTLVFYGYGRHYLTRAKAHSPYTVWLVIAGRAIDGVLCGSLAWLALGTTNLAGDVMVFAVIAGMTGGAVATLSPVFPAFVAYVVPALGLAAMKVWLMDSQAFDALSIMIALYAVGLTAQAINNSRASRTHIEIGFELAQSHQKLRAIEHQQTIADERQRMVQDMHDGLGSSLVSALRVVEQGKLDAVEVAHVLQGCIDDLKLAIDSMEAVDADLLLLLATLRFRLEPRLKSSGIELLWQVQPVPALNWLDQRNALHILRILQEAFTNIIKHSQASEISVATYANAQQVRVVVTDNGAGFNLIEAQQKTGNGLRNQQRRAEAIGATVSWDSGDSGTAFSLRLPVMREPSTAQVAAV